MIRAEASRCNVVSRCNVRPPPVKKKQRTSFPAVLHPPFSSWLRLPLASAVFLLLVAAGCERRASRSASIEAVRAESGPTQESWGTRYDVLEDGAPRVQMEAAYMARYEEGDSTYLVMQPADSSAERVLIHLYDEAGDSSATVRADRVRYYEEDDRFVARGNVVVLTREGKRLLSEHLSWDEATHEVSTPGFVRIISPDETIQGYGLVADEDLTTYTLSNVTGHVLRDE